MGEEAIRRNEADVPLQPPPPVQNVRVDKISQDPGKIQKGGGLRQMTTEETGLGTHPSNVHHSKVLEHATVSAHHTKRSLF